MTDSGVLIEQVNMSLEPLIYVMREVFLPAVNSVSSRKISIY